MIPVSKDTLLRVVRRRVTDHGDTLAVIGIDDFAFRRGQTRFDKTAKSFAAFLALAAARIWMPHFVNRA
jgi:hypothetical protein